MRIVVYADGSRKPEGGVVYGYIVTSNDNWVHYERNELHGGTANMAEYAACAAALSWILTHCGGDEVELRIDSELLYNHVRGTSRSRSKNLVPWLKIITTLISNMSGVGITLTIKKIPSSTNLAHRVVSAVPGSEDTASELADRESSVNESEFSDHHYW